MSTKSTDFSDKKQYVYVKESVLRFFLDTYKLQLGALEQDIGKFIHVGTQVGGQNETYELQVRREGKWVSRRMGIAPLGDGTGSKSKCFKVFYDDILVVKIPPTPIKDFEKYIEGIHAERRIAEHLTPDIECIFPSISALLRKLPLISFESDISVAEIEQKYIEMLITEPQYQEYLKIGDTFAFFMSLSKHSFFSSVMEKMHDRQNKLREEVSEQMDVMWDAVAFEEKYGSDKTWLFFELSNIYALYENTISALTRKYKPASPIPGYKKKEWFLIQLADIEADTENNIVSPEFMQSIGNSFANMPYEEQKTIRQYRKMISEYIYQRSFEQNKTNARSIIRNLLKVTGLLSRKGVAIRDLKPDNIFVIGDMRSADYSMGLIDFETAVVLSTLESKEILQPMLAGTPSYATPSHLFRNEVLTEMLNDLPRVMYHQDWYAMMVMIYHTVTGDRLFEETRKFLPKIGKLIYTPLPEGMTLAKLFKYCSRTFWHTARQEFEQRIENYRKMLEDVEVVIPEEVRLIFQHEVLESRADLAGLMRVHIRSQNIFKSEKSHQDLLKAPHKMIRQSRINWEKGVNVPQTQPAIRLRIISFMQKLEEMKRLSEEKRRYKEILDNVQPHISVYDLLRLMFGVVLNTMYKAEWEELPPDGFSDAEDNARGPYEKTVSVEEFSTEETMSYEKTIPDGEKSGDT